RHPSERNAQEDRPVPAQARASDDLLVGARDHRLRPEEEVVVAGQRDDETTRPATPARVRDGGPRPRVLRVEPLDERGQDERGAPAPQRDAPALVARQRLSVGLERRVREEVLVPNRLAIRKRHTPGTRIDAHVRLWETTRRGIRDVVDGPNGTVEELVLVHG